MRYGKAGTKITYHEKADLLYIRLDEWPQEVTNQEIGDSVILDLGENDRIVGIEILDASRRAAARSTIFS
jgi:uncharacterized protein YuzE